MDDYESGQRYVRRMNTFWTKLTVDEIQEMVYSFAVVGHRYGDKGALGMADALVDVMDQRRAVA